jgi:hypothetical protein
LTFHERISLILENREKRKANGHDLPILTTYFNPELERGAVLLFKEFTVGEEGRLVTRAGWGIIPPCSVIMSQ